MRFEPIKIPEGIKAIGVKVTPEMIAGFFREGYATINTKYIPARYHFRNGGFNPDENVFYLYFATKDCPEGMVITWVDVEFYRPHDKVIEKILEGVD